MWKLIIGSANYIQFVTCYVRERGVLARSSKALEVGKGRTGCIMGVKSATSKLDVVLVQTPYRIQPAS